ncbi:hypothetical protein BX600DRAFT_432046 [Xylariales sp. PMI_506]|nr:hypothetical protein BX600DRAFT_432046 [Xylariales sp. PMI_506]
MFNTLEKKTKRQSAHSVTIRLPIPSDLPLGPLIAALQGLTSSLDHHPLVTSYEKRALEEADLTLIQADPFLGVGSVAAAVPVAAAAAPSVTPAEEGLDKDVAIYDVTEEVSVVPGGLLTKRITFPSTYVRVEGGVRFRVVAGGGVVIWGEMTVQKRRRREDLDKAAEGEGTLGAEIRDSGGGGGDTELGAGYEMVDQVNVEAPRVLLPFVKRSMAKSHQKLCEGLLGEVVQRYKVERSNASVKQLNLS